MGGELVEVDEVGKLDGRQVGAIEGAADGAAVGATVGLNVGAFEGATEEGLAEMMRGRMMNDSETWSLLKSFCPSSFCQHF